MFLGMSQLIATIFDFFDVNDMLCRVLAFRDLALYTDRKGIK
jgi:hypothetical protein